MWRIALLLFVVLISTSGCKEPTTQNNMVHNEVPDKSSELDFEPYANHVSINNEVMSSEKRNQLKPITKEMVSLLDDYIYAFNNNLLGKEEDKFSSVDTPSTEVLPGKSVIKIAATDTVKVVDQYTIGIAANVEARHNLGDDQPFWKGKQVFLFNISGDKHLQLTYWNTASET